jgi:glycosyltransferase involved in cell wall biosynthesis
VSEAPSTAPGAAGGAAGPAAPSGERARTPEELDVTIVVPVQTPDAEVDQVVAGLGAELDREGRSWECVLVFDGVRGAAWSRAQELARKHGSERVRTIAFQNTFGESMCLSAASESARGRVIITSPQYVQIDPLELGSMLAAIDEGADVVAPWRHERVDPLLNRLQSVWFNWLLRLIIRGGGFHDLNCTFRAIRRDVLEDIAIYGDMYRFLPVIAHRQGYRVVEVRVRHLKEWGKAGFYGIGVYVRRALDVLGVMFLTKFTLKPLRFFGFLGLVTVLPGAAILAYVLWQRIFTDAGLYGRPVFLLAVMLVVLGVQIVGFGLVGEIIIYSQARNLRQYRIERIYESPGDSPVGSNGDGPA